MFHFIADIFKGSKAAGPAKRPVARRTRLSVEVLEGRALPSVSPIFATLGPSLAAQAPMHAVQVPDLTGVVFHLISSNNIAHDFTIKSETHWSDGSATFTATWSSSDVVSPLYQTRMRFDAHGNIAITFNLAPTGPLGAFYGTITKLPPSQATQTTPYGNRYHFEGSMTLPAIPGHGNLITYFSGDGGIPFPVISQAGALGR